MEQKILYQGAEAVIIKTNEIFPYKRFSNPKEAFGKKPIIIKKRIAKRYRIKEIDNKIIKKRTKAEKKLLEKASKIINVPKIFSEPDLMGHIDITSEIRMEFIGGKKLSEHMDDLKNKLEVMKQIGESAAKLHDADIIHGDLTTSNMILYKDKIYFIDFGLGFHSKKIEDKAVDLHLLKQALEAKHFKNWEELFESFISGYKISRDWKKVIQQLKKVEGRGRYKH